MASSNDSRPQYMSLALLSRHVIDGLLELVRTGSRQKLTGALPDAIGSLEAATDSRAARSAAASRFVTSYDQVRTIDELFPEGDRRQMIEILNALKTDTPGDAKQREHALKAIDFFHQIENRALRNSRNPSQKTARAVRRLCVQS